MGFYQYRERDFIAIPASELEKGDEIAYGYGGDLKYGAIRIENITRVRGASILLQYRLPVGAIAESTSTNRIRIYWKGNAADIHISQDIDFNDRILIRKQ